MKPPNQKKCTIAEMVEWAAQMNGKVRKGRKAFMIAWILANIEALNKLQKLPWSSRNWAMTAMRDIELIGVYDTLSLVPPAPPINGVTSPIARLRKVCEALGLHLNKINGRSIITRQQLTAATKPVMVSDLPVERRGETSPEFGLEIDMNAKPTQLCQSPN